MTRSDTYRLLHGGRQQTHICDDGMVIIFPGDGTSHVDVEATERNQSTKALSDRVESQGREIQALKMAISTMEDAKRGPA